MTVKFPYCNISGGLLIRALLRRGEGPKVERLLDFPPLPLFTTSAFLSRTTLADVFASDLAFLGAEWRVECALVLFAAVAQVAPETSVAGVWMERASPIDVGSATSDVLWGERLLL